MYCGATAWYAFHFVFLAITAPALARLRYPAVSQHILTQNIMSKNHYSFTSESVSAGHPDKLADQISDAILDAYLAQDPHAKVACECLITTNRLVIAGEITSNAEVDAIAIAKQVLDRIGYNNNQVGFNLHTATYENLLHTQSREIFESVVDGGAGDQGIMFGYACNDTPQLMPLALVISQEILKLLHDFRNHHILPWLRPDAKSQVSIRYENGKPASIETVVVSTQHDETISQDELQKSIIQQVINPILGDWLKIQVPKYYINPSGSFTIGGPHGDTGLTGRKIVVDTYGGICPHGGGAFSGKDPSKVDRSAAYAARYIAKHLVAAGLAERCTVQLSYAIGVSEPTSIFIDGQGTERCNLTQLIPLIFELFPTKPNDIIEQLQLKKPIYYPTAQYGHFGNPKFPWEVLDPEKLAVLHSYFN